jgi:hypothetical protein
MSAAQAAADEEASLARLQKAVENTGVSWTDYGGKLDAVVEAGMKRGFDDDAQRASLSLLMAQTGDADEAMRRFALSQDVSRGAGIDLEMSSKLLGKVTEENANVFKKMGINLEAGASETEAFAALQQKFGGQAEAYAKSSAGQFEVAKIQMGELKEDIGAAVLPMMVKLASAFTEKVIPALRELAATWIPRIKQAFTDFANSPIFATAQAGITTIYEAGKALFEFITSNKATMIAAIVAIGAAVAISFGPASLAIAAIAGIILAVGYLSQHWDDIQAKTEEVWNGISDFFDEKLGFMRGIMEAAWTDMQAKVEFAWETMKNYFITIWQVIKGIFDFAQAVLKGDWQAAWDALKGIVTDVWDGIKLQIETTLDLIKGVIGGFPAYLVGLVGQFVMAAASLGVAIKDGILAGLKAVPGMIGDLATEVFEAIKAVINVGIDAINDMIPNKIAIPYAPDINLPDNPIPRLSQGGIVRRPTLALLGENGPEAVIPLNRTNIARQGPTFYAPVYITVQGGADIFEEVERQLR